MASAAPSVPSSAHTIGRAAVLVAAGVIGAAAVLPYALTLNAATIARVGAPTATIAAASLVQSAVLIAVAVVVGLWAAGRVGLRTPLTDALVRRAGLRAAFGALHPASDAVLGVLAAMAIIALDVFSRPLVGDLGALTTTVPPRWQGLLASLYGGITEELLTRLFLVSVLAWLIAVVLRAGRSPRPAVFWTAIIVSAVLFGAGHLPTAAALVPLSGAIVARIVVLNAIPGVAFGWLYWRRGLEAAMIAHFRKRPGAPRDRVAAAVGRCSTAGLAERGSLLMRKTAWVPANPSEFSPPAHGELRRMHVLSA